VEVAGAADRIGRGGRADRCLRYGLDREAATDAAEILAVEKIGAAVLAERKHESLAAVAAFDVKR
jgi:hypothetical protein